MRKIKKIYLHCSDSLYGCAVLINNWHKANGWEGRKSGVSCGYHFIGLNGCSYSSKTYLPFLDGMVEVGRPVYEVGAHVRNHNRDSIGYCFIGKPGKVTIRQLTTSRIVIAQLLRNHKLAPEDVIGHSEVDTTKTCPGLNMNLFRLYLQDHNQLQKLMDSHE